MITQQFDLNLIPNMAPVVVNVDQYDTGTGRLVISLYKDDTPYTPSSGATARIQGTKPDGHGFEYSANLSGNTVTANLTEQMTPIAGDVRTQIVIHESNRRTGTFAFILRVQHSALPDDTEMSASDYPLIEQAFEAAEDAIAAATAAAASKEDAAYSEWQAAISRAYAEVAQRSAANSATAAAASATSASTSATNAGNSATNAATSASNASTYANQAGTSATNASASEQAAKLSEQNAKASEDILSFYSDFVAPHFIIQNNRLYINDPSIGDFVVANNRLYFKLAS